MHEPGVWRRFITVWVAAGCLTAIICCWLLRPLRYAPINTKVMDGGAVLLNKSNGGIYVTTDKGTFRLGVDKLPNP